VGVLGEGDQSSPGALELEGARAEEPWRLASEGGTELVLEGLGEPAPSDPDRPGDGFDQLCRVTGRLQAGSRTVDCLGWRGTRPAPGDRAMGSFRLVSGWFGPEDGFVVLARRPRKARGQDEDLIDAMLFDPGGPRPVAEPRLSTTYDESAQILRTGAELWIEAEGDPEHLHPRRGVGRVVAKPARWTVGEVAVEAQPLHWFSGDREGPGVYVLGQW
jgi:hypothetical protein